MLFMLLFVPTRMVAQTDPRCALFNSLDGITDVTITDNGDYPWQMMDLKAEGMTDISFEIPEGSTGLMSSNYNVEGSTSETVVNFKVEKSIFLTFKHLVSSESYCDKATITIDNKKFEEISGMRQIEIKESLSAGEHTLKLSYQKDYSGNNNADRTFIYDLKTATSISDNNYIAEYNAKNTTLTFKKVIDANISDIGNNSVIVEKYNNVGEICKALGNVTIKNIVFEESFKTYAPTSLKEFFYNCTSLETISGLEYLNTANITDMSSMFYGCSNLTSLNLTKFDTKNVSSMYFMFYGCSNLTSLNLTNFNTKNVKNMNGMFGDCTHLTSLDITNFNTAKVTNMGNMFLGCSNLTSLDLTNFNTAKVTDMHGMFKGCSALTSLDLTNFNTAEVRNMNRMFNMLDESSTALTTIYVSDNFVTTNVRDGENMFKNCTKLKGFQKYFLLYTDHQYANYKTGYFTSGCGYAEFDNATGTLTFRYKGVKPAGAYDLNVESNDPGWNAQSENIKKVVFDASFANARPTSCCWWFGNCFYLTEIEGIENLNTQNVTDMRNMFTCCYELTSLDVSNFNTQNVEDMTDMFLGCEGLSLLDLSNFNTERVEYMSFMFSGCSTLQTIFASDKFVTDQVFGGSDMFSGCTNLKGFIDYISDSGKDGNEYANYKTGYFTKLVGKNGEKKIGAAGEALTTENLILEDGKDFVAYEPFAAKNASYSRDIPEGSKWGTLCLPFAIDQSKETECKFYRLTGIDNDNECITLESCEEGIIPAGTPVLFKMNKDEQTLSISTKDASIVKEPVAGTNVTKPVAETASDVNLVGSFTKIGGNGNQGLDKNDYIIGKDKFWLVSELNDGKGVGIKPMRAYIHPATASQARAAMLSIGKGDGTTAIDNLNAISNDANAEYYDANGRRTNGLQKGLNIVKRGSKTYKIMVK